MLSISPHIQQISTQLSKHLPSSRCTSITLDLVFTIQRHCITKCIGLVRLLPQQCQEASSHIQDTMFECRTIIVLLLLYRNNDKKGYLYMFLIPVVKVVSKRVVFVAPLVFSITNVSNLSSRKASIFVKVIICQEVEGVWASNIKDLEF